MRQRLQQFYERNGFTAVAHRPIIETNESANRVTPDAPLCLTITGDDCIVDCFEEYTAMSTNETIAMPVAGSMTSRIACQTRNAMGLALATTLLVAAPQAASAEEYEDAVPPPAQYHNNGQRIAGGILIGTGAVSLVGFGVVAVVADYSSSKHNAEGGGLLFVFVGLPLLAGGLLFEGIGIPLYINGSKPPQPGDARVNSPAPMALSIGVGPQSASLKLTF